MRASFTVPPCLWFVAGASLAGAPAAQGFVERAAELGLVHEVITGFDRVGDSSTDDWAQRGLAVGDLDGDGDPDLVCCGGLLPNTVLRNDGGVFVDITAQAGIEVGEFDTSPCLADVDLDGDLDLYIGVCAGGGPEAGVGRLYRNDGQGNFEEISTLGAVAGRGNTLFAQWADLDLDGLLDLVLSEFYGTLNAVYRNNGDGTFRDWTVESGLDSLGGTHVTAVLDADDDGLLDVLVGNDYVVMDAVGLEGNASDLVFHGQSDGTWLDLTEGSAYDHMRGIMGLALGDVNYDGRLDVYKTDSDQNRMSINLGWPGGDPWLPDEQLTYGIAAAKVPWPDDPTTQGRAIGWGTVFMDFDFDLWLDLFVVNGMVPGLHTTNPFSPRYQRNFLYTGNGPAEGFTFTDATEDLGIFDEIDDRCCAAADPDQDGDVDLFVTPTVGPLRFYENQIDPQGQGWLMVRPVSRTSAPGAFGVKVSFTDSLGYPHVRQIGLDGNTAAQSENFAYFGLGHEPAVDLTVEFPSGIVLSLPGTAPDQVLSPEEPLLVEVSARTLPISVNPGAAGTSNRPTPLQPADLFAVTAYAHDAQGTPLDGGAAVSIDTPGLVAKTDVIHLGGNAFRRYFEPPTTAGEFRAEVSFDGWACRIRPRVIFYDPTDTSGSTAALRPESVRAGSADTFEVVVAPKAAGGVSLGAGDAVTIEVDSMAPLEGPTDLGDGRYQATFAAPATPGLHPVQVSVNGQPVDLGGLALEAGGELVLGSSTLEIHVPHINTSASPHQYKVKLISRDASGWRMGSNLAYDITAVPDAGTPDLIVRQLLPVQRDGDYPFIVEKPLTTPPTPVSGVLELRLDGILIKTWPYDF